MRKLAGFKAWLWQRLSAIYLAGLSLFLLWKLHFAPPANYAAWRAWWQQDSIWLSFALGYLFLLLHAWVGLRDIVLDYIKPLGLRLLILALIFTALSLLGLWLARILLSL